MSLFYVGKFLHVGELEVISNSCGGEIPKKFYNLEFYVLHMRALAHSLCASRRKLRGCLSFCCILCAKRVLVLEVRRTCCERRLDHKRSVNCTPRASPLA